MSYSTFATIVLSAGAGFCIPYVLVWFNWRRNRNPRYYE